MTQTFDQRFYKALTYIIAFDSKPLTDGTRVVEPGVDAESREAIVALQAQVDALHRGVQSLHCWLVSPEGGNMKDGQFDQLLTAAADIREPEIPRAILIEAGVIADERRPSAYKETADEDSIDDPDDSGVMHDRRTKPLNLAARAAAHDELRASGRRERKPKMEQPATLSDWFHNLSDTLGVALKHHQILYRHMRFEQPKVIFLPDSDADHQKIIYWAHSKIHDYTVQYGTEESTEQHWVAVPAAALSQLGFAVPDNGDGLRIG